MRGALILLVLGQTGCHWLLPLEELNGEPSADQQGLDLVHGIDARRTLDNGPGKPDVQELFDGSAQDSPAGPDIDAVDMGKVDAPSATGGCASNATLHKTYPSSNMVLCAPPSPLTQCQAEKACAPTWRLCTATDYLGRGGKDVGASNAWLASCIRDGKKVTAPSDSPCSCTSSPGNALDNAWDCQNGLLSMSLAQLYLGAFTSGLRYRIGSNTSAYCAYWAGGPPTKLFKYSACCN